MFRLRWHGWRLQYETRRQVSRTPGGNIHHARTGAGGERWAGSGMCSNFCGKLRDRAGLHQCSANRIANKIVRNRLLAEADFSFRWMYVDVHFSAGQLQKQKHDWENHRWEDIAISLDDG